MLCQHCRKNQATVNFIEKINGETFELHLCGSCYAYKYGEFESEYNGALLNGLFDSPARKGKTCKVCGTRLSDYEKTGLLGCASCYDVFKEELMPSIVRIHGKGEHVGKAGGDHSSEHDLRRTLSELQEKLEAALQSGDYLRAGRHNEQMKIIKKKLTGGER